MAASVMRIKRSVTLAGFTLLELLVVIAIIAAIASIGVLFFPSAIDRAQEELVLQELQIIAAGVKRFEKDMGYLPRSGPYAGAAGREDAVSPVNFQQLLLPPANWDGYPAIAASLQSFNPSTGRGWRGPYLSEVSVSCVSVGDEFQPSNGDPFEGDVTFIATIADPFEKGEQADSGDVIYHWRPLLRRGATTPCTADTSRPENIQRGRPYLLVVDDSEAANISNCLAPCVMSMGPNGLFDDGSGDDIVLSF